MRTVAIAGSAGGVGRTTCAISLAAMLSKLGRHVLLVDLDEGAGSSSCFDIGSMPEGVTAVLRESQDDQISQLHPHDGTFWFMPFRRWSNLAVAADVAQLRLRQALQDRKHSFDVVILDCGRGFLGDVGTRLATQALVPTAHTTHALSGLFDWMDRWDSDDVEIGGPISYAVLNDALPGRISADKMRLTLKHNSVDVIDIGLRYSAQLQDAGAVCDGVPFVRRFPKAPITKAYEQLAREVLTKLIPLAPHVDIPYIGLRELKRRHAA